MLHTAVADGVPEVLRRTRENLMRGASHIKIMAGGGVSSNFDPLDVAQYAEAEIRAAVDAAADWGTYVTVHAYTPAAIQKAIRSGVKCIDHGQLADEGTARLMAEKGIWWCLQPFLDHEDATPFPEGSINRKKQLQMVVGTDTAYGFARKYKIKLPGAPIRCSMPGLHRARAPSSPRWCAGSRRQKSLRWQPAVTPD
jgi:imidazolonepropionase-like amidohydrolase